MINLIYQMTRGKWHHKTSTPIKRRRSFNIQSDSMDFENVSDEENATTNNSFQSSLFELNGPIFPAFDGEFNFQTQSTLFNNEDESRTTEQSLDNDDYHFVKAHFSAQSIQCSSEDKGKKATGESKPIPYASLLNEKIPWVLEGLPVPVKEPSNYGIGDLHKIINSNPADIKFVKKIESPAADLTSSLASTTTLISTTSSTTTSLSTSTSSSLTVAASTATSSSTVVAASTSSSSSTASLLTSSSYSSTNAAAAASNILQQIISNNSILEPVHDLTEGTEETTESIIDEPAGPSIPIDIWIRYASTNARITVSGVTDP